MAILNKSSDGIVSVLVAMVRTSVVLGEIPRHKLLGICCPKSLVGESQTFGTNTLNRWQELGLFHVSDDQRVTVVDEFRQELRKSNATAPAIADVARRIILAKSNNKNFWSDTENKAADFTRAAAWMLAQDVYAFAPIAHATVEPLCNAQALSPKVILLQNDTRWPGYKSWATFLGFGRSESGKASGGFVTDPTLAIMNHVKELVPKKGDIAINDFLDGLVQSVPVLDGGEYRREVEGNLKPDKWKSPSPNELSTSLSRALLRLRAIGTIRLDNRSDSDAQVKLIGRDHDVVQSVTHVLRGDAKWTS